MEQNLSLFYGLSFLTAALAFAYAAYLYLWVKKQKVENRKIIEVSKLISEGASAFISREYRNVSPGSTSRPVQSSTGRPAQRSGISRKIPAERPSSQTR